MDDRSRVRALVRVARHRERRAQALHAHHWFGQKIILPICVFSIKLFYIVFFVHHVKVFAADLIIFYPSVVWLARLLFYPSTTSSSKANNPTSQQKAAITRDHDAYYALSSRDNDYLSTLMLMLVNPTLVLIDHGHFQYNCISLGLMQLAVCCLLMPPSHQRLKTRWLVAASALFTLALNYKQMELYHALPFFFFLLGVCWREPGWSARLARLACIGATVVLTFGIVWWPFVALSAQRSTPLQVLARLFPFARGLFEDKVANVWCSLSVLVKLRERLSLASLSTLSLAVTAALNLPSGLDLLRRPSRKRFMLAAVNSALVFYLFSFQVHEKSIMLATM